MQLIIIMHNIFAKTKNSEELREAEAVGFWS